MEKIEAEKERQFQEELARQREALEKQIRDLETKQLTENEKIILKKMEEIFVALGQFDNGNFD